MKIYFASNRDLIAEGTDAPFGVGFSAGRPYFFRVGHADVVAGGQGAASDYAVTPGSVVVIPETSASAPVEAKQLAPAAALAKVAAERPASPALMAEIRRTMVDEGRDVLLFLHGFNTSFSDALEAAGRLQDAYLSRPDVGASSPGGRAKAPLMFMFSWPSDGQALWKYQLDRQDAQASGVAIARSLQRLTEFLTELQQNDDDCGQRIHLVAHSMGAWALRAAIQELRQLRNFERMPRLFHNVFLMAADEDDDAMETDDKLRLLTRLARSVHIYHSQHDRALFISDATKGNTDRLGVRGPRTPALLSANVTAIDCSDVSGVGGLTSSHHDYYSRRLEVIDDVRAVLAGGHRDAIPNRTALEPGKRYRINAAKNVAKTVAKNAAKPPRARRPAAPGA